MSKNTTFEAAMESGGRPVVGFVALRQNKPAQSGRLGLLIPSAPLGAARLLAARAVTTTRSAHLSAPRATVASHPLVITPRPTCERGQKHQPPGGPSHTGG